ncbi:MAG: glycosyltransferase family 9 protein [Candidatus Omnitrophota bacterium]
MVNNPPTSVRWLLMRNGAIGDTILLSSAILAIREQYPCAWIELMGNKERMELLTGAGLADCAVSSEYKGVESLFWMDVPIHPVLKEYLSAFDFIICYTASKELALKERLQVRQDQIVRIHPALPDAEGSIHASRHYLHALDGLVPIDQLQAPRLSLTKAEIAAAQRRLDELGIDRSRHFLLVLHAGAGSRAKQAPPPWFAHAAQALQRRWPLQILLTQGPADGEAVESVLHFLGNSNVVLLQDEPLRSLAAILKQADLFIGNDSGVTHMAAAAGCPSLAIFTAANPAVWAPLGDHVRIVDARLSV